MVSRFAQGESGLSPGNRFYYFTGPSIQVRVDVYCPRLVEYRLRIARRVSIDGRY